jgi:uncharacterized membrane protein
VLWNEDGEIIDLGTLPGGTFSAAMDINKRGEMAGMANPTALDPAHAVLWELRGGGSGK